MHITYPDLTICAVYSNFKTSVEGRSIRITCIVLQTDDKYRRSVNTLAGQRKGYRPFDPFHDSLWCNDEFAFGLRLRTTLYVRVIRIRIHVGYSLCKCITVAINTHRSS